ncbi:M10 family metallopeptidase C-terminal domain-containing protein, partial [Gammaproteobacteria bacterium]|nr:M10 family metallopeptidase C-terminal domain-containing protein [Gammaproteobacteria bacterium]
MPLLKISKQQVIEQLESGNYWLGGSISYSFPQYAISTYAESAILNAFSPIPDSTRPVFRLGFHLWDDLIPQQIKEIPQSSTSLFADSDIEVAHFSYSVSDSFAFAYYPDIGSVWLNSSQGVLANPLVGNYGFFTVLHELGHALGLNHMGDYNGSSAYTPFSYQDSTVLSIMSYFGPSSPLGNNEVMQADWVGGDGQRYYVQTPMVNDVLAIQKIYGRSGATRTGNTTYGFNTNLDENDALIFDFGKNLNPILTIFDSSGNADWIDLSGWSTNSFLDLRAGNYSSANEMTNNIAIAFEVIIENGVTGNGNDTLIGNSAANYLNGGGGHDELIGGIGDDSLEGGSGDDYLNGGQGSDTAIFNFSRSDYTVNSIDSSGIVTITSSLEGTDRLEDIELFSFSDGIYTIETISASPGTETSSDKLAPILLSVSPEDNADNVASGIIFEFTFSEPIQRGSGDLQIYNADGTLFRAISVNNTAQVLISGSMITLKLAEELSAGSSYYINIGPGVIKDQAGNFFAG